MAFWLSALIAIPAFILEFALLIRGDVLAPILPQPWREAAYLAVCMPLIEETVRYGIVRLSGRWELPIRQAMLIGLGIGLFECFFKSLPMLMHSNVSLLGLLSNISSVPLQIALSIAFFSFVTHRWLKMLALHILLNVSTLALWSALASHRVGAILTTTTMLFAITAASVLGQ
jgi:hypothetical protein